MVLEVEQRNLRVAPGEPVAVHELVDPRLLDHPVELARELHQVRVELREHVGPAGEHVLCRQVGADRVHVARRTLEVLELHLERSERAPVLERDRLSQRRVVGDVAYRLHG